MTGYIAKKDVVEGIKIIQKGLAFAGMLKAMESLSLGETFEGYKAIGAGEAYAEAVKGIDAFLADLEAFPEADLRGPIG